MAPPHAKAAAPWHIPPTGRYAILACLAWLLYANASAQDNGVDPVRREWVTIDPAEIQIGAARHQPPSSGSITLAPGQSLKVRVPANEMLRAVSRSSPLSTGDLQFAVASGIGIYAERTATIAPDNGALLLDDIAAVRRWVRVSRPKNADQPLAINFHLSRHQRPRQRTTYRREVELPADAVSVARIEAEPIKFWRVGTGQRIQIRVTGPSRLLVEARYEYPPYPVPSNQRFRLYTALNGEPWRVSEYETFAERTSLRVDGQLRRLGRIESAFLTIAPGEHTLTFDPTANLLLRVRSREASSFLLPRINALDGDDVEPAAAHQRTGSYWEIGLDEIDRLVTGTPRERKRAAFRIAQDNSRRDGGLIGADIVRRIAAQYPGDADLGRLLTTFIGRHTMPRDLAPIADGRTRRHRPAAYPTRALWTEANRHLADGREPPIDALTISAGRALFHALSVDRPLQATLPKSPVDSLLRVVVDANSLSAPTRLSVRYDNGTVSTLFVDPADIAYAPALFLGEKQRFAADTLDTIDAVRRAEPAKEWILAGYVELALPKSVRSVAVSTHSDSLQVALQYRSRRPFELTELELQEALRRVGAGVPMQILQRLVRNAAKIDSGDIANTGSYAIQLGAFANFANADRLTAQLRDLGYVIYQKLGHIDATAVKRVLIGPFPDREAGDRARREFRADKRLAAAITRNARLVEVAAIAPGAGQALELDLQTLSTWVNHDSAWDLAHHYLPLARLLKAADRRFRRPVAPIVQQNPAELTPAEATRLEQLARRHQQDGAWLPALQAWSILARSDLADARRAGYSGTVRALFRLGEVNLADRLLRSLFLYDRDPVIRDNAFSRLVEYNRNQNNNLGLQNLLASAALRIPGVAVFRLLSENLLASDRPDLALTLATALPRAEQPVDVVLLASLQERAWSLFEATLDDVRSEVERNLWRGFRAQREHRYDLARDYWKRAGDEGAALRDALIDGLGIAQRMNTGGSASAGTIRRWEAWQQKHPGERQWRNAEAVVVESGGSVIVYSPERDEYSRSYRSTRELPARISIDGPAKIRIRARPLYADTAGVPFDGWIHVHNGDRYERFPINGNRPAEGVDLVGADELLAGLLVPIQYEVGPGHHEINVFSDERPLLLGVDAWLPELPLAVLAELRHPSAAQLADGIQSGITQSAPAGVRRVIDQIGQWLSSGDAGEAVRVTAAGESKSKAAVPNTSDWVGPSDRDFAIRQMQELVWETERGEVPAEHLLPAAARIATQYPDAPGMQELLARLTRRTVWQPVRSVEHSAGSRFVETIGWHPGSPSVQVRKTLLGEIPNDNHVISSRQQFGLELSRSKPSTLEIELTRGDLPFLLAHPLSAYYVVDDGSHHGVELMPGAPSRRVRVEVPAGAHTVSVGIDKPFANQFLKIRVAEIEAGRTVPIPPAANLMYQVATLAEPLIVRIKGPAWLRVDERAGDRVQQHFKIVADGWQTLTFGPTAPRDESLFRLYRRAIDTERHLITLQRPEQATPRLAEFRVDIPEISAPAAPALTSTGMADESVDGVWNAYGSTVQRRNFDEDNVSNSERFLELGATHRYYSAARNGYFRTDFLGRIRETGGPTLGVRERIELRSENHRYLIRLGGSALAQNPGGNMDGAEWAASLFASVISERPLGENTNHYPTARIFRRWLSLDADEITEPDRVDQDIFTEYKSQHLHGLSVTDTLIHRPWLDTRWYAAPTLTTNEDFNPFDPEFVQLRLGWKQLVGTWELDAQYRLRHYLEDDDRANSFTQHLLRMDLDWSPWIIDSRSWQATFRLSHDIDSAENSFRLSVSRPFRNSRTTLRHFRPGEIDFLDIRRDHAINSDN